MAAGKYGPGHNREGWRPGNMARAIIAKDGGSENMARAIIAKDGGSESMARATTYPQPPSELPGKATYQPSGAVPRWPILTRDVDFGPTSTQPSPQSIQVEAAALHDRHQGPVRRLEQSDVLERIAVDDEQVGERLRPQAAELALHPQHPRSNQRRRADDFQIRDDLGAEREFTALVDLKRSEQIRPVGHRDAGAFADLERAKAPVDHQLVFHQHLGGHSVLCGALPHRVIGDQIGDQEHALLGH